MGLPKIMFRADGNERIGLGHIHRSLALAQMLSTRFEITFAIYQPLAGIKALLESFTVLEISDLDSEIAFLTEQSRNYEILVLDGYRYDAAFQLELRNLNWKIICIDDLCLSHVYADVIINHAGGVRNDMYEAEPYTQFFLGPQYAIVKQQFLETAKKRNAEQDSNAVFICMGGGDTTENHTLDILRDVTSQHNHLHYYVVVGEAYPFYPKLNEFAKQYPNISILQNLSSDDMLHYMSICAIAICPPSGVAYEYLHVGGELYLRQTASNQQRLMEYLISSDLAFEFGNFRVQDMQRIRDSKTKQALEFDGHSGSRLIRIFESSVRSLQYSLRLASSDDVELLFRWVNDPEVRKNSINRIPVEWSSHVAWFTAKLNSSDTRIYILVQIDGNIPVGQIRFDQQSDHWLIDYSIDAKYRGMGLGAEIARSGITEFLKIDSPTKMLKAEVLEANAPSLKVFDNLSFKRVGALDKGGRNFIQFQKYPENV